MGKWKEMDIKTKVAIVTAVLAFFFGWGLTIAGFIIGAGIISDSVLWVLGQSLVYAASIFGVGMYVSAEVKGMKQSIKDFISPSPKHSYEETQLEDEM